MTPETKLKNQCLRYLKSLGDDCWFFKVAGGPGQKAGVPDIVGCYRGKFFAVENKSATGKTSPKQDREIDLISRSGGRVQIVRSLGELESMMEGM
jgi:Holliday junction resolvase